MDDESGLLSRVAVIEEQPLPERAAAYDEVYARLRDRLEGGDARTDAER